jgi:Amt family ammonium transporter
LLIKDRLKIDDALDVSSVHGIAGIIGSLAIGIFASSAINPNGPDGLLFGNPMQLLTQAMGVGVAAVLGFGGTYVILKVLKFLVGIRVSKEVEELGLDMGEHAEQAYAEEEEFKLDEEESKKLPK